jgi:hypothetical protein
MLCVQAQETVQRLKPFDGIPDGLDMVGLCNQWMQDCGSILICGQRFMILAGEDKGEQVYLVSV